MKNLSLKCDETLRKKAEFSSLTFAFYAVLGIFAFTHGVLPLLFPLLKKSAGTLGGHPVFQMFLALYPLHILLITGIILAFWIKTGSFHSLLRKLRLRSLTKKNLLMLLLFFAAMIPGLELISRLTQFACKYLGYELQVQTVVKMALQCDWQSFTLLALSASVLAPVSEELAFRFVIYTKLRRLIPCAGAAVVTSLFFAAIHWNVYKFPALFVLGLLFQYVYLKTRNLNAAILLHMMNNTMAMLVLLVLRICAEYGMDVSKFIS